MDTEVRLTDYALTEATSSVTLKKADVRQTLSDALIQGLHHMGIQNAFGIVGGGIAHLYDALCRSNINVFHCRHETGAVYSAIEAFFASGVPTVIYTTTGPGALNAVPGLAAAKAEDAKVLVVSGISSTTHAGRWSIQETSAYTPAISFYTADSLFDLTFDVYSTAQLCTALRSLQTAFASPSGCVARICIPMDKQGELSDAFFDAPVSMVEGSVLSVPDLNETLQIISENKIALIVGFGCRNASKELTEFSEVTNIPVALTPRAKGIINEGHPNCLGVIGLGGYGNVERFFDEYRPDWIIVIGTRMGEASTFWSHSLVPRKGFIHVDLESSRMGSAFPTQPLIGIRADARSFLLILLEQCKRQGYQSTSEWHELKQQSVTHSGSNMDIPIASVGVHPVKLMDALQKEIIEKRDDVLIMAESGNAFVWTTHHLRFSSPGQYRISTLYGAMGHFSSGAFGAACVRSGPVISIVGDGSFLMMNELHTAVQYNKHIIWIILNDASYSTCHYGLSSQHLAADHMMFPSVNFVSIATGLGAQAQAIKEEDEIISALQWAMDQNGPIVLDIYVKDIQSPFSGRIKSLFKKKEKEKLQ